MNLRSLSVWSTTSDETMSPINFTRPTSSLTPKNWSGKFRYALIRIYWTRWLIIFSFSAIRWWSQLKMHTDCILPKSLGHLRPGCSIFARHQHHLLSHPLHLLLSGKPKKNKSRRQHTHQTINLRSNILPWTSWAVRKNILFIWILRIQLQQLETTIIQKCWCLFRISRQQDIFQFYYKLSIPNKHSFW